MDSADILTILRDLYGLTTSNYPDDPLMIFINKAVKKLSEFYPECEIDYIETVANQTRYTITEDNLLKLKHVYYTHDDSLNSLFNDPDVKTNEISKISTFQPSREFEKVYRLETLRRLAPKDAEIIAHNKFDLIPTPTTSGDKVYYEYERYRTLAEVPDIFEDDILDLIFYFLAQKEYRRQTSVDGGHVFNFDRRGNIEKDKSAAEQNYDLRRKELKDIQKSIEIKAMKMRQ
jgi:hypothetical protein